MQDRAESSASFSQAINTGLAHYPSSKAKQLSSNSIERLSKQRLQFDHEHRADVLNRAILLIADRNAQKKEKKIDTSIAADMVGASAPKARPGYVSLMRFEAIYFQARAEVIAALDRTPDAIDLVTQAVVLFNQTGDVLNCSRCVLLAIRIVSASRNPDPLCERYISKLAAQGDNQPTARLCFLLGHIHVGLARKAAASAEEQFHLRAARRFLLACGRADLVDRLNRLALN